MPAVPAPVRAVHAWTAMLLLLLLLACRDSPTRTATVGPSTSQTAVTAATSATSASASSTVPPAAGGVATTRAGGGSTAGSTTPPVPTSVAGGPGLPPSPPPTEPVVVGGGAIATNLAANPGCDPANRTRALVKLSWIPAGGAEQLVAVSTRSDGFQTGVQAASEPLAATRSTYELSDSQPGGVYYWRVLTRVATGWAASATAEFDGPTCVAF